MNLYTTSREEYKLLWVWCYFGLDTPCTSVHYTALHQPPEVRFECWQGIKGESKRTSQLTGNYLQIKRSALPIMTSDIAKAEPEDSENSL